MAGDEINDQVEPGAIQVYLGLYLLLLAIFVLLNSLSSYNDVKTEATLNSVSETFADATKGQYRGERFVASVGLSPGADPYIDRISSLVQTALPLAQVEVVHGGQVLKVEIPADVFFVPGDARLRPESARFLDNLVVSLEREASRRFDLQFLTGSHWISDEELAGTPPVSLRRAGAFAAALVSRGAGAGTVLSGVDRGDADMVRILIAPSDAAGGSALPAIPPPGGKAGR